MPGCVRCRAISVVINMPAPASSTNDAAICVTANDAQAAVGAGGDAHAAGRQAEAIRRVGGRQPRHEGEQHRGDQGEADTDPQQRRIDREIERAHRVARGVARQHRHHGPGDQHAEDRAGAAQQQALGQQRAAQRRPAGAERGANRQLAFAAHRSREDQVGDVRARDDEDQARRRQQHQQHRPRRRRDLVAQLHRFDPEVVLHRIRLRACSVRMAPCAVLSSARACSRSRPATAGRTTRSCDARGHPTMVAAM